MAKDKKQWDVLVACGGTFGHIRPALTVANRLEEMGYKVALVCARKDKKFPLIAERNPDTTFFLDIQGFPKSKSFWQWKTFSFHFIKSLFYIGGFFAFQKPRYVIAAGSFISYPPLFWAKFFRVPYSLLEQNSIPGYVSEHFFKGADNIFFALSPLKKDFLSLPNARLVGNPLSLPFYTHTQAVEFFKLSQMIPKVKTVVGIIGGSLGAKALIEWAINQKDILEKEKILLLCITGGTHFAQYENEQTEWLHFVPFVKEISYFYTICDFIIARAGASTISELLFFKKTALFVPYPLATQNHQFYNAKEALFSLAGDIIEQENLSLHSIKEIIDTLGEKEENWKPQIKESDPSKALETITTIIREKL